MNLQYFIHTAKWNTQKTGIWTDGLDIDSGRSVVWTFDTWILDAWTSGPWKIGRLDASTLNAWTLGFWKLGCLESRRLDP